MTITEAVKILRDHQAWRKGGDGPETDPRKLSEALEWVIKTLESKVASPKRRFALRN